MRLNPPTFTFFFSTFSLLENCSCTHICAIHIPPNELYGMHKINVLNMLLETFPWFVKSWLDCNFQIVQCDKSVYIQFSVQIPSILVEELKSQRKSPSNFVDLELMHVIHNNEIRFAFFLSLFVDARNFRCSYKLPRTGNVYDFGKLTKA